MLVPNFRTHTFWGAGHVAFAMLPAIKRLGAEFVSSVDCDKVEENNLIPYVLPNRYLDYTKVHAFSNRSKEYGYYTYGRKDYFEDYPNSIEVMPFTVNNWFTSDSWEARIESVESVRRIIRKDIRQENVLKKNNLPQYMRFFTLGIDPEHMYVMVRMSVIKTKYNNPMIWYRKQVKKQLKVEKEFLEMMQENSPGGVQCALHNHPYLTVSLVKEAIRFIYKYHNREGDWLTQVDCKL